MTFTFIENVYLEPCKIISVVRFCPLIFLYSSIEQKIIVQEFYIIFRACESRDYIT